MKGEIFKNYQSKYFHQNKLEALTGEDLIPGKYYSVGLYDIGKFIRKTDEKIESYKNKWSHVYEFNMITSTHLNKPVFRRICSPEFACFFKIDLDAIEAEINQRKEELKLWELLRKAIVYSNMAS